MLPFLTSVQVARQPHKTHPLLIRLRKEINAQTAPASAEMCKRLVLGAFVRVSFYANKPTPVAEGQSAPRPQVFTGVVTALQRGIAFPTFTVRAVIDKIGVEQVYPMFSPLLSAVKVLRMPLARRRVNVRKNPSAVRSLYAVKSAGNTAETPLP